MASKLRTGENMIVIHELPPDGFSYGNFIHGRQNLGFVQLKVDQTRLLFDDFEQIDTGKLSKEEVHALILDVYDRGINDGERLGQIALFGAKYERTGADHE